MSLIDYEIANGLKITMNFQSKPFFIWFRSLTLILSAMPSLCSVSILISGKLRAYLGIRLKPHFFKF
jgi:hypothetical protein